MNRTSARRTEHAWLYRIAALLVAMTSVSCSSDAGTTPRNDGGMDSGGPHAGADVGSPCTTANDCGSPTAPACLTQLKPLSTVAGVPADIAAFGLDFPDGYCSSVLNCSNDQGCGTGGGCFRPFRNVTATTLRELEDTFPTPLTTGSLDFLVPYGVCLATCTTAADCQSGYSCEAPLNDLIGLVPGAVNDTTYCVPNAACSVCDVNANCDTSSGTATCICKPGYTGNGMTCTPGTSTGTNIVGSHCTADNQCLSRAVPACLPSLHPLASVAGVPQNIKDFGVDFAQGYCSTQLNCTSNLQCDPNGKGYCFQPFRDVTAETLVTLEQSFEPDLASGALNFLPDYAVCMRKCTSSLDCESEQSCEFPLSDLISLVPGSTNVQRLCVPNAGCANCTDAHAYCDTAGSVDGLGTCKCDPGWSDLPGAGTICTQLMLNTCASSPCLNGGTCVDGSNGAFTCTCTGGFTGQYCEIVPVGNPCASNPCQHGGTCSVNPLDNSQFVCACTSGYTGSVCETMLADTCTPNPCASGLTCTVVSGGHTCDDINECLTNNGGCSTSPMVACNNSVGSFSCGACPSGYTGNGVTCTDVDECLVNNGGCPGGASCMNSPGSYSCGGCPSGYTLSGGNCVDINECATNNGGCSTSPMVTCNNTNGSFSCGSCPAGYTGNGVTCTDVDECGTNNGGCSTSPMVTCTNSPGSFSCGACPSGYAGNGMTCTDLDECALMTAGCAATATCMNTTGSYTCTCNSGYMGNGMTCSDVLDCATNNGGCSTSPMVTCNEVVGGPSTCGSCPAGYTGNGTTCTDVDECSTGAPCDPGGTISGESCMNNTGSYTCTCPAGYSFDGTTCVVSNVCTVSNPCSANAVCMPTGGSTYTCTCNAGYTGNGVTCTDVNECATNNGGCSTSPMVACNNTPGGFSCGACPAGYSGNGVTCIDINECATGADNCATTATCTNTTGSFTCACNGGYSGNGVTCTDINECSTNNGGCSTSPMVTCTNSPGTFMCGSCPSGYTGNGMTCTDVNECSTNNGGCSTSPMVTCNNSPGSFSCGSCPTGYTGNGMTCTDVNECSTNNGGCSTSPMVACTNSPGSFMCASCPAGYTGNGMTCTDVNECSANTDTCTATQRCTNSTGSFTCTACGANASGSGSAVQPETCRCNANYAGDGTTCMACQNGGTATAGSATCTCPNGFSGTYCQTASTCGNYTDVVYSIVARFAIKGTTLGIGNQTFTGLMTNATTPMWGKNNLGNGSGKDNANPGNHSAFERPPYVGGTTFTRGFARVRFANNASGVPIQSTASLVEWYVPMEFHQTAGATLDADVDHSVGIIDSTLANCGGGDTQCLNHVPALTRPCTAGASGTFTGTTLNWGTCTPAPSGANSWSFANARVVSGVGCARYTAFGNTRSTSTLVPASGVGDSYQTWNQQMKPFAFSGTDPLTATFTMAEMQIPNGTGASNTWLSITASAVIGNDCGTTPGTDLICNVQ